jgi:hypothetical protein
MAPTSMMLLRQSSTEEEITKKPRKISHKEETDDDNAAMIAYTIAAMAASKHQQIASQPSIVEFDEPVGMPPPPMNFRVEVEESSSRESSSRFESMSSSRSCEMDLFCIVEETELDLYSPKCAHNNEKKFTWK